MQYVKCTSGIGSGKYLTDEARVSRNAEHPEGCKMVTIKNYGGHHISDTSPYEVSVPELSPEGERKVREYVLYRDGVIAMRNSCQNAGVANSSELAELAANLLTPLTLTEEDVEW